MTNEPTHSPTHPSSRPTRWLALALGGLAGIAFGACQEEPDDDSVDLFGEQDCRAYCDRAVECNDEINKQECVDNCIDAMSDCQADEQDMALDQFDMCADKSCDDFLTCTVGAGLTCYFGI